MKYNQEISFRLDNAWYGRGLVKVINPHSVEVELLTTCKEFPIGAMIIVDKSEINGFTSLTNQPNNDIIPND